MKKRTISLVMAIVLIFSMFPMSVFAAGKSVDDFFDGMPISADPGTGTTKWVAATLDGEDVLKSGNAGKSYSTSTLTLTFTESTHLSFEYKVSSEEGYDTCTIQQGSNTLVNGESGDQAWKGLEVDAAQGDKLTIAYKKDSSGDRNDDCVYLRNFSAGAALTVTFHANNGTKDTATQKIFGGKGTLKANAFTCEGKIFAGWATSPDGAVAYEDGAAITLEADLDLYAQWSDAFTVTFDNDGTTTTVLVPRNSAIGNRIPEDPTKRGYTFQGWFNGDEQLTAETVISGDVTYTAKWTPITYTITLNPGYGEGETVTIPATYDQEVTLPKNTFTRRGYRFNGWAFSKTASSGSYEDGAVVKNLARTQGAVAEMFAAWYGLPVQVTVHLNYEGAEDIVRTGVVESNYNYTINEEGVAKYNELKAPVRTGYIFDGWFDAAEGGKEISTSYKFTADDAENGFHMYAHWTKGITVHFDGNGYKSTIADKTVTPDKVFSSLPYMGKSSYPDGKTLDGWYIKNADGSFGEAVTKDTVFTSDEVTLIAKWRDYRYVIRYNVKYSDKSSTTGTMADQTAPFGQNVVLTACGFSRTGYVFAGWSESSYGSTVQYADGATINRPFEEGGYWDDGSEDGEIYNLYAIWTESKTPEQLEAEAKLSAAETAISGTYNVTYGKDTNALTMIRAKLAAAGITDVTVTMKEAASSSNNYVSIAADGTIGFKWNENGSTPAASGTLRPTLVLTYGEYTQESTGCLFNIPLDEAKAMAALRAVADRITVPTTVESADDFTALPQYPLKAGVDESKVDYNSSSDLELWTTATWTSGDTGVIAINEVSYPYFAPYKVTVTQPKKDTGVTLTLKLVYNGREDLCLNLVYTVLVKGNSTPQEVDYQALLEAALTEYGLHNPRNGDVIDTANVTSDIQFPTTKQLSVISYREYAQGFDGKYTPILLCTSNGDVVISADPDIANVARMVTYRPLPGQEAKTVTVTMKILSRPSGEGTDYASMTVLASKDITLTVQPLTQTELDAAEAFMTKVCTEDVYWEGIRLANVDRDHVTGDMRSFIEIVPDGDGYKFIRNMDDYNANGVKADDIPGWYDAQKYRCFRSSDSTVVSHENLLVTQPRYNTRVTIDGVLTYSEYAKYYEKFRDDPAYASFAKFYQQPISTTVTVIGTEGIEDPDLKPVTVTINVDGSSMDSDFKDLTGASYACTTGDHRTAADALLDALTKSGYTYTGTPGYITGVTDPAGKTLSSGAEAYGPWSGWMFTVNGEMPILGTDEQGNTLYATLDTYQIKDKDVIRFYYVACPTETGHHTWNDGEVTRGATCTADGEKTYTCTMCGTTKTEVIPATGHAYGQPIWTWTEDHAASARFVCANDESHVQTRDAAVTSEVTTPADCETDGVRTYTATVTFRNVDYTDTTTEVIPATGHLHTEIRNAKDATCTEDGYTGDTYCTDCGKKIADGQVIPATGHDFGEWTVTKAAACEEDGEETRTCSKCDAKETRAIPATGHLHTEIRNAKDAACTENGYTGDTYCTDCSKKIADGQVIPAAGHDFGEWTMTKAAACEAEGEETRTCSKGDATETRAIPATGHKLTHHEAVAATCTASGMKEYWSCDVCGKLFADAEGKTETTKEALTIAKLAKPTVTPSTGDDSQVVLWTLLAAVSAAGAALLLARKKRTF